MPSSKIQEAHFDRIKFVIDVPDNLIKGLWDIGTTKFYKAGTVLTKPGQSIYYAYFIHTGAICQYVLDTNGNKNVDSFVIGPKFTAPSLKHLFNNVPSNQYYEASTDIEVHEVRTENLFKFTTENPLAYKFMLYGAALDYRQREIRQLNFKLNSSQELYRMFKAENSEIEDQIPLTQIASYLNIQPGSLSRIRRNLK